MYRKFTLYNSINQKYELANPQKKVFFYQPQGLGFTKEITIEQFDKADRISSEFYQRPQISGELLFFGNLEEAYQEYYNFTSFIANTPLKLEYLPPNTIQPFYIECVVSTIEKSEVNFEDSVLHCPVVFFGTTLWKRSDESRLLMQRITSGEGKKYPLLYPYAYESVTFGQAQIKVDADLSIPFELNIDGSVTNPRLQVSQNNEVYGIIQLVGSFDTIYINTDMRDEEMRLTSGNAILVNPYNYQDYSVVDGVKQITFFDLKVGINNIDFSCQNLDSFDGTVELRWKDIRSTI